jgi:hypothetical protein
LGFIPTIFCRILTWANVIKLFVRNLQIFVISLSVCPLQAFKVKL